MSRHRLRAEGAYDGLRLLSFLGAHAVPGVETWDGTTYARTLPGPAWAAMTAVDGGIDVHLVATGDQGPALERLVHLLDLDRDGSVGEGALALDPLLGPLLRERPGLRVPGSADDGETLVRTVIGQQVSVAGARTVTGRVVARHGRPLPTALHPPPGLTHLFPTPDELARADPLDLPMPRARARAVVACAVAVRDAGGLPPRADLLVLPGVGPWTADYVALRCHRDPDVFLAGDLAVRRALERSGRDGTPSAAAALAAGWSPYRSLALMHLWTHYLGEPPPDPELE